MRQRAFYHAIVCRIRSSKSFALLSGMQCYKSPRDACPSTDVRASFIDYCIWNEHGNVVMAGFLILAWIIKLLGLNA